MQSEITHDVPFDKVTDDDIIRNQFAYDPYTIERNIRRYGLNLRNLVRYQKLTPYICAKYVVFGGRNERYADCREDAWISTGEIPRFQSHITLDEMYQAHGIADVEDDQEDELDLMRKEDTRMRK